MKTIKIYHDNFDNFPGLDTSIHNTNIEKFKQALTNHFEGKDGNFEFWYYINFQQFCYGQTDTISEVDIKAILELYPNCWVFC